MGVFQDLSGRTFGRLRVLSRVENTKGGSARFLCRCECGNTTIVPATNLRRGKSTSCRCLAGERASQSNFHDLSGQRFGRLEVVMRAENDNRGQTRWCCVCSCSNKEIIVSARHLVSGRTVSCGCWRSEVSSSRVGPRVHLRKEKVRKKMPEYATWWGMIQRCCNPNSTGYKKYGAKGITVCNRWRFGEDGKSGFECFLEDMGSRPTPEHEIDRWPNKTGNYEPANCRWATEEEQQNNKTSNRHITDSGRTLTFAQWERERNLSKGIISHRSTAGWPAQALLTPVGMSSISFMVLTAGVAQ